MSPSNVPDSFIIEDIESTDGQRMEFDAWFTGLIMNTTTNPSCFWRDVIRDNRRNLFLAYIERCTKWNSEIQGPA